MVRYLKNIATFINRLCNLAVVHYRDVEYDELPTISGRVDVRGPGKLKFGTAVTINSDSTTNPVGLGNKCMFHMGPGATITIGNNVGISTSLFYANKGISVEDKVLIGGGCQVLDSDFHSVNYEHRTSEEDNDVMSDTVRIKHGAFIGASSLILKGVTIGSKSIVAAGSVVTKSIPDGEVWGGNPAAFIKKIE